MKLKKLFSVMTMMLVSIFAFSSCVLYVNEERAVERIRVIPPDKALDFTVVMENSIVTNMDGEQKEINLFSEVGEYYTVNTKDGKSRIDEFYLYNDWLYYDYYYSINDHRNMWSEKASVAFMRTNIYTGETENFYDFGKFYEMYNQVDFHDGRYCFLYLQGLLKIFDMETNQFIYEHRLIEKDAFTSELKHKNYHQYNFMAYSNTVDYIKDGQYYHYKDGVYEVLSVPTWVTRDDGGVNCSSTHIKIIENYLYTYHQEDVEEDRKAYDLDTGAEVDYMTVVKPLRDDKIDTSETTYAEENKNAWSKPVLYKNENKNYEIEIVTTGGHFVDGENYIRCVELDEHGEEIENTVRKYDSNYLVERNDALNKLRGLWCKTYDESMFINTLFISNGRLFFTCHTSYSSIVSALYSSEYLCEIDPISGEVDYLGYYGICNKNRILAVYAR